MKYLVFIIVLLYTQIASGIGLSVDDLVKDYNDKFGSTGYDCLEVSEDMYRAIYQNMQKANLQLIGIRTGSKNPYTGSDGHAIVTYTEGRTRFVVTTWSDDGRTSYVKKVNYGGKTLHEVCESLVPNYKYIRVYTRGFGYKPKTRYAVMNESGHYTKDTMDIWTQTGKTEGGRHEYIR